MEGSSATTDVQLFPKELDEKVVKLHFPALGADLTVLTREQAVFMVVEAQALSRFRTKVTEQSGSVDGVVWFASFSPFSTV